MADQPATPVDVVRAWEQAVNALAVARALELSHPNVEIVGPRGVAKGRDVLKDWLSRAGLSLETRRSFARDCAVVNDQHGLWRDIGSGDVVGEAAIASHYKVENGQVTYVARYETLDEALAKAGVDIEDAASQA